MILSIDFRTDIPAFYSEWILNRFREGYLMFRNPASPNVVHKVILDKDHIEGIMWCSKDYSKILSDLHEITDKFPSVFHYTITGYGNDIEPNVPNINRSIGYFRELSRQYGKDKVIWRYDPIFLTDYYNITTHVMNFGYICRALHDYTDRVVVNFVSLYEKVKRRMPELKELTYNEKYKILFNLVQVCNDYGMKLQTCGNGNQFKELENIEITGCLDRHVLTMMGINTEFMKKPNSWGCLCYPNTSVGTYETCMHKCKYCYASTDFEQCEKNYYINHDPHSPLLLGHLNAEDKVIEMKPKLLRTNQLSLEL